MWFRTVNATGTQLSDEQHLSGPFNFAAAPDAGGRFVGDYEGLTAVGSRFHPFFAITNCQLSCPANRTDIYTASVTPTATTTPIKRHGDPRPATRNCRGSTATPGPDSMTSGTAAPPASADRSSPSVLAAAQPGPPFAVLSGSRRPWTI